MRHALVERLYASLATGDRAGVAALLDPAFVATFAAGLPFGGTYHGTEAIERGWWEIGRLYKLRVEPSEWIDCADGRLLVVGTYVGEARSTRRPVSAAFTHLFTADGEYLTRLVQVTDSARWVAALDES